MVVPTHVRHPLAALKPEEMAAAVSIVGAGIPVDEQIRFVMVKLHEPAPEAALFYKPGDVVPREVFLSLLDKAVGAAYEAIVNLTEERVSSWKRVEGQPGFILEEFLACEDAIKADPRFQEALARRGITDLARVHIDPWSAGHYGDPEEDAHRVLRTTVQYLLDPANREENTSAHPVARLQAILDLNTMQVIRVDDFGAIPIPQPQANYLPKDVGPLPTHLKPLQFTHPESASLTLKHGYRGTG